MTLLIVYLISLFFITVIGAQGCFPCVCLQLTTSCITEVTGRNLSEIPDSISSNVNELYFNGQLFTILKNNTFTKFHNLTKINFSDNKIDTIEEQVFQNLTKLSILLLIDNQIQSLPDRVFHDLRQIKEIYLSGNSITDLPKNLFSNLSTLTYLSLDGNKIKILPREIFQNLRQIKTISLSGNSITKLHQNLFSNLPKLSQVDISYNEVNIIEEGSFSKLPYLQSVVLRHNKLKNIQIHVIDNIEQLKYFDLSVNPWHCDEDLCAVMNFASNSSIYIPSCRAPAEIAGKPWTQILNTFIPNITNDTLNVEEGETVYLQCKYCFASKIIWHKNIKTISRNHNIEVSNLSLTSTLILSNVTQNESGYYSCHVQDCETCEAAGAYLKVNYRKPDNKKFTVTDLVPTTSLVTQSTTTEDPADASTHISGSTNLYIVVATVLITFIAIGIFIIFNRQKSRNHIIIQKEPEFSFLSGPDPVPFPPPDRGWTFKPRIHRATGNFNQSRSNQTTNNRTSGNNNTNSNTRRNEQTSSYNANNSRRNVEPTSDNRTNNEASHLLPMETGDTNNESTTNRRRNEQPTSDNRTNNETSHLLPMETGDTNNESTTNRRRNEQSTSDNRTDNETSHLLPMETVDTNNETTSGSRRNEQSSDNR